jgi:hypothetical protein
MERAFRLGSTAGLMPLSRSMAWVEIHLLDGGIDLIRESVAFAGHPRGWLAHVRARQLLIGLFAGVVALGAITIVLAGRLIGKAG